MADRDIWEKGESLSKIFAAVLIPVVLGIAGVYANQALEKSKTRDELLKQAIDVVFLSKSDQMAGADKSFESRRAHRSHWLEIYNSLSDVKLSDEFIAVMMEQDARADGTALYWSGDLPGLIPNAERTRGAESTNEDELGHGWVAVGHLGSKRYSDVNFNVPRDAMERDGIIKPHEIIRARWSVTLRSNSRNLEDRQGYTGTSLGLLWGGECAKVIDSRLDGRLQTWAFIKIVQCPLTTKSDPGFEPARHVRRPFVDPVKTPDMVTSAFDPKFFVEWPKTHRRHQVRLDGGDCSSDSYCYP
jgi:hypothetical protein